MPLILAPSFNSSTREEVEDHLEQVRELRLMAALEYQQGKELKLEKELDHNERRLATAYDQLGKAIIRLDREIEKIQEYLDKCEMLHDEVGLVKDRISLAKR